MPYLLKLTAEHTAELWPELFEVDDLRTNMEKRGHPVMSDHARDCPAWSGSVCRCYVRDFSRNRAAWTKGATCSENGRSAPAVVAS